MDTVARRARQAPRLVRAALPPDMRSAVVARQACLTDVCRLHRAELPDVPLGVVVDMRLPGAMATLAAVGCRR